MTSITTKLDSSQLAAETAVHLFDDWFDPIETGVRDRVQEFIQELIHGALDGRWHAHATGRQRTETAPMMQPWLPATGTAAERAR